MTKNQTKITIKEIAELAGVSIGTVSRIINNKTSGYSEDTYKKVMAIIEKSGYVPNRFARSMVTNKNYTIAYIVEDLSNPFFPEVAKGIMNTAAKYNYNLVLGEVGADAQKAKPRFEAFCNSGLDGVITGSFLGKENIDYLLGSQIPFVIIDANRAENCFDNVSVDNYSGSKMMTEYLVSKGHTRIACITGPSDVESSMMRLNAFKTVLARNGLSWKGMVAEGDYSIESGYEAMRTLIKTGCTAVFALNDQMAMGACNYLHEHDIKIPDDVSVAGFDDIPMARCCYPPLTTVHQPLRDIGHMAASVLIQKNENANQEPQSKVLDLTLAIRKSVKDLSV